MLFRDTALLATRIAGARLVTLEPDLSRTTRLGVRQLHFLNGRDVGRPRRPLSALRSPWPAAGRDGTIKKVRTWTGISATSPDGTLVASVDSTGNLIVTRTGGGPGRTLVPYSPAQAGIGALVWSPDSSLIGYSNGIAISVVRAACSPWETTSARSVLAR
jgi:hypothetical protein